MGGVCGLGRNSGSRRVAARQTFLFEATAGRIWRGGRHVSFSTKDRGTRRFCMGTAGFWVWLVGKSAAAKMCRARSDRFRTGSVIGHSKPALWYDVTFSRWLVRKSAAAKIAAFVDGSEAVAVCPTPRHLLVPAEGASSWSDGPEVQAT